MSEGEYEALYEALTPAITESGAGQGRSETDWFILMAAQRIAHTRLLELRYPETYPRPAFT